MILVQIKNTSTSAILLKTAYELSTKLDKSIGVLMLVESADLINNYEIELNNLVDKLNIQNCKIYIKDEKFCIFDEFCDEVDASFLIIHSTEKTSKSIRKSLEICRNLRIPYMLFKESFGEFNFKNVILPIGFLEEELEKAQFASAFGRFCESKIFMYLANDYGSKALINADRMRELFDRFDFNYVLEKASKDSFKVELEAIKKAEMENAGLIIVSASRDYGLDDLIFGPKEYHVVKKSPVPVLLVNPRGDLYALCD